ncbi:hypothetical protein FDK13_10085 [Dyadobacter frigoris]|uniref:Uncharacterized protein n=1 Tax=Dyadobacter frigoris TaxID=2576211 RepID=A0A4U6D853_9BACT|nr:hypothetical protein FDK13_10085 [Dyadobacter frigoris]
MIECWITGTNSLSPALFSFYHSIILSFYHSIILSFYHSIILSFYHSRIRRLVTGSQIRSICIKCFLRNILI